MPEQFYVKIFFSSEAIVEDWGWKRTTAKPFQFVLFWVQVDPLQYGIQVYNVRIEYPRRLIKVRNPRTPQVQQPATVIHTVEITFLLKTALVITDGQYTV